MEEKSLEPVLTALFHCVRMRCGHKADQCDGLELDLLDARRGNKADAVKFTCPLLNAVARVVSDWGAS
eukprot:1753560-Amphidinium_carterae.1